jgi:hypothetical protein
MDRHNADGSLKAEHYDPRVLSDNSGTTFRAAPRNAREGQRIIQQLMVKPERLQCPECWGDKYIVIADDHPTTGLMALVCANPRCGAVVPPIEAHKPQLQDATAKRLGLWTPGQMVNMGDDD